MAHLCGAGKCPPATQFLHAREARLWLNTGPSSARGAFMPKVEPHRLPATSLVRLVEGGELTAEAVVRSCLERIADHEPVVRAWSHLAAESALAGARELDKARQTTLLGGVPFGIKDIFDTADMPTTYGSYVSCRPASDASAAA